MLHSPSSLIEDEAGQVPAKVQLIEYHGSIPAVVVVGDEVKYFTNSKSFGLIYERESDGGLGKSFQLSQYCYPEKVKPRIWNPRNVPLSVSCRRGKKWSTRPASSRDLKKLKYEIITEPQIFDGHANPLDSSSVFEADRVEYCRVCKDYYPDDEECRHMFWSDNGHGIDGPGVSDPDLKRLKTSMQQLASFLGKDAAEFLGTAIRDHRFYFHYTASLLGGPVHFWGCHVGQRRFDNPLAQRVIDALEFAANEYGESEAEIKWYEECRHAIHWLFALWAGCSQYGQESPDNCGLATTKVWDRKIGNLLLKAAKTAGQGKAIHHE